MCLLVIIGVTEHGRKELVAVEDGYRESEASWLELLWDLRQRGLTASPKLATGDGALGFWKALAKVYPQTRHQRCWVHKTANVLNKVPKAVQPKVKSALHDIWMAETRKAAHTAFDRTLKRFGAKYPKAMDCLAKDREALPFMISRRSTGCIFAPPTRSSRPSPPSGCEPGGLAIVAPGIRPWRWFTNCSNPPKKDGSGSKDSDCWNWSSTTCNSTTDVKTREIING